ncbi:auxin-responsive protein IAA20 [Eucalyptus grandis]|uniref:Uncharacterized protein n=3 Tax=Eucalyptus TaxID=3932 RepID=A0ACC3IS64_EUCGR|nr:auxin-responsive protein IAA20 [Eucalyptus grandis]KAK3404249.1 hypothetical protein EUGRSUZ_K00561 [Eucalyptus grandis]
MGKGSSSSSASSSTASSMSRRLKKRLTTDLNLALGFSPASHQDGGYPFSPKEAIEEEGDECDNAATFYVKVYMEGIPIGRKLDLMAHGGYCDLIRTLDYMFNTNIMWSEEEGAQCGGCHVLLYEDKEGDWLMVGDVPWEMFLSSVKRLKITRIE